MLFLCRPINQLSSNSLYLSIRASRLLFPGPPFPMYFLSSPLPSSSVCRPIIFEVVLRAFYYLSHVLCLPPAHCDCVDILKRINTGNAEWFSSSDIPGFFLAASVPWMASQLEGLGRGVVMGEGCLCALIFSSILSRAGTQLGKDRSPVIPAALLSLLGYFSFPNLFAHPFWMMPVWSREVSLFNTV